MSCSMSSTWRSTIVAIIDTAVRCIAAIPLMGVLWFIGLATLASMERK